MGCGHRPLHDEDLITGYAGVFLDNSLDKKYRSAAKDFIWQWFFPQESLTYRIEAKELRRYHLHETKVQEVLYEAVEGSERSAGLLKKAPDYNF